MALNYFTIWQYIIYTMYLKVYLYVAQRGICLNLFQNAVMVSWIADNFVELWYTNLHRLA